MPDMKKVIKGMEMCISPDECSPDDCPYYIHQNNESGLCWDRLMTDALALLKEQEAVEPITEHHLFLCPVCKNTLFREQKFCHECGKRINWEGR